MDLISLLVGGDGGWLMRLFNGLSLLLSTLFVTGLTWLWTKIGTLLVMKSSRANEYEADAFSFRLGYGDELCALLDTICGSSAKNTTRYTGKDAAKRLNPCSLVSCGGRRVLMV